MAEVGKFTKNTFSKTGRHWEAVNSRRISFIWLRFFELRSTNDRLVFTLLHWFRTDLATMIADFHYEVISQYNACLHAVA